MFWVVTARLAGAIVALFVCTFAQRILHQCKIAAELHIHSIYGITEDRFLKMGGVQQVGAVPSSSPGLTEAPRALIPV